MDTIRNIVSRRPPFVRTLIHENAVAAFETLKTAPSVSTKEASRIHEDYKKEATKRAEEFLQYIKQWSEWTPDSLPRLEPFAISRTVLFELVNDAS
jgi:hypothetical protein